MLNVPWFSIPVVAPFIKNWTNVYIYGLGLISLGESRAMGLISLREISATTELKVKYIKVNRNLKTSSAAKENKMGFYNGRTWQPEQSSVHKVS